MHTCLYCKILLTFEFSQHMSPWRKCCEIWLVQHEQTDYSHSCFYVYVCVCIQVFILQTYPHTYMDGQVLCSEYLKFIQIQIMHFMYVRFLDNTFKITVFRTASTHQRTSSNFCMFFCLSIGIYIYFQILVVQDKVLSAPWMIHAEGFSTISVAKH